MNINISTFPPCILSREASYGVYLPSVMNQSQGMNIHWIQDFSGKGMVVGVCVCGSAHNHSRAWKFLSQFGQNIRMKDVKYVKYLFIRKSILKIQENKTKIYFLFMKHKIPRPLLNSQHTHTFKWLFCINKTEFKISDIQIHIIIGFAAAN